MEQKKVFGIISYFPNRDSAYHVETRRERSRRFKELLFKLEELWPDIDIMIIAQNWQDFELPKIKNKITAYYYGKLGILGARKELRKRFLDSDYDYLIMLDDDGMIQAEDPSIYMNEIDKHPDCIGVIRHVDCPLMLLAISKTIYSQVDMPDIDAEKGEGFEDDLFVATCFAKFPDKSFDFPKDCISETSFKYTGEGECPSTWARERRYNWKNMVANTKSRISAIERSLKTSSTRKPVDNPTIDLIISYVNGSDSNWLRSFSKATGITTPSKVRFRSWGTLKYLLRGIYEYMPFIRNVILVVASKSQVPIWLNTSEVRVVCHDEFIPTELLPTFNSCTIESYFWNISGLSDRVIYFNDDVFPINYMTEDDFFTGDIPHIKFTSIENYSESSIFRAQCRSSIDMITDMLGKPRLPEGKVFRPYHISAAFNRKCFDAIGTQCKDAIFQRATNLRQSKNVNQYIYSYYNYFTDGYEDRIVNYKYFAIHEKSINEIMDTILGDEYSMVCINDSDKIKDFNRLRYQLNSCFDQKFPTKCKYEI